MILRVINQNTTIKQNGINLIIIMINEQKKSRNLSLVMKQQPNPFSSLLHPHPIKSCYTCIAITHICIYIYIYREREREREINKGGGAEGDGGKAMYLPAPVEDIMFPAVDWQRASHNNHAWRRSVVGEREKNIHITLELKYENNDYDINDLF